MIKKALQAAVLVISLFFPASAILSVQESISTTDSGQVVELTEEERVWLKAHPDITLGYTDAFEPEIIVNPDGTYSGLVAEDRNQRDIFG